VPPRASSFWRRWPTWASNTLVAPNALKELLAGEDLAGVAHEQQEQLVLAGGQLDGVAVALHLPRAWVDHQVVVDQWLLAAVVAAEHRADPREQLVEVERLGDVVVGAEVERVHLVDDLVAGGQHHDRDVVQQP
jgi:hypothetical protein